MSRILHHVGRNDFKKTRQRQIGEQKERAAQKLKEWQEAEVERKQIEEASRPYKSNWRRENLREFGEWAPIETSGPTNSTSTTFGYFAGGSPVINGETGQQITFTYSGLNGVENYPTTVTIDQGFGDTFQTAPPPFSQIGVQGYTAKLNPRYAEAQKKYEEELKEWERKKEQQQKDIEATLKSLGTSLRDMQKNAGIARVGNSYVALMPGNTTKYDFGSNLMNNIRIVRLVPYDSSKPMELARNVKDADGKLKNWNVSNSQISNDIYLGIGEPPKEPIEQEYLMPRRTDFKDVNPQLDASQEFAQKVGADEFMNARVDVPPDPSVPLDYNPPKPGPMVDPYADRILELNVALDKMKEKGTLISRYKSVRPGEKGYVDTTNMANAIGYNRKPIYTAPAQEMFAELERLYALQNAWLEKQNPGGAVPGADDALDDYNRSMGPNSEPPEDPYAMEDPVVNPEDEDDNEILNKAIDLLNLGLDVAAVAGILFPEPGTTAGGLTRLATRGQRYGNIIGKALQWYNKGRRPGEHKMSRMDRFRDEMAQRQRISSDPNSATNPFRGMPGYGTAKSKLNPRIRAINNRRASQGKSPLSMDKINPGGAQTGPTPTFRRAIEGQSSGSVSPFLRQHLRRKQREEEEKRR